MRSGIYQIRNNVDGKMNYKFVVVEGVRMNLADAARSIGVAYSSLYTRAKRHGESYQQVVDHFIKRKGL